MKQPKAPTPPNPTVTAAAQTGQNVATAIANQIGNMTGQVTPYGSQTSAQTGSFQFKDPNSGQVYDMPTFTQSTQLSKTGQYLQGKTEQSQKNLADLSVTSSARLQQLLGQPFKDGIAPRIAQDWSKDRQRAEGALMSRLNPQLAQDQASLDNTLRQQGLMPGSSAYEAALKRQGQIGTDARMAAILAGGQEQDRMAGLYERGRAASLNEAYAMRSQPINEILALQGGAQVQNPTFGATPGLGMPTTDYAGLINNNFNQQMGIYDRKQQSWNGLWGGLLGAGAKIATGGFGG